MSRSRHRTLIFSLAAAGAILAAIALALLLPVQNSSREIWFDDLTRPLIFTDKAAARLAHLAHNVFTRGQSLQSMLPPDVVQERDPRMLFLSAGGAKTRAITVLGSGRGFARALQDAIDRFQAKQTETDAVQWVLVDVVSQANAVRRVNPTQIMLVRQGLMGLATTREEAQAWRPSAFLLEPKRTDERLKQAAWSFQAASGFSDGEVEVPLYRGHRSFDGFSREDLIASATRAGAYLVQATHADGRFDYIYEPVEGIVPAKYNILRHAGTIFAMGELYAVMHDEALIGAVRRAISFLLEQMKPCGNDGKALCVVERREVKLGGNALAIVALTQYQEITGDRQYLPLMEKLARWILEQQHADGKFQPHKIFWPEESATGFVSDYYPGEALLALVRLYDLTKDAALIDAAERGARWLITVRDVEKSRAKINHDHWLLYAFGALYRHRPKQLYLDHAMKIAGAIVARQNRKPRYPDWLGSYYKPPRSTPTAIRSEGLAAAWQMAQDAGRAEQAKTILTAINRGVAFELQTQFDPEWAMFMHDPERAMGAFRESLTGFEIRIDYVQHNISALLQLARILGSNEKEK